MLLQPSVWVRPVWCRARPSGRWAASTRRLSRGVDTDLGWRLAAQVPIAGVPEPLVTYRQHPAQIHRNTVGWEQDNAAILDKAFGSGLLPPEVQALERRARANLALTVAYLNRQEGGAAAAKVGEAFRLSPLLTASWFARAALRRLAAACAPVSTS